MRVAIVENTKVTHHGQVGVALHEKAALIDLYKPWLDGVLPKPNSFDALVVFGGEQSAMDDALHPYLPDLAALMADTAVGGVPVLGICLGAQLFARGLGAQNILGRAPEFGWCEVAKHPQAAQDAVLGTLPGAFDIFQWHSDTFTPPPGACDADASAALAADPTGLAAMAERAVARARLRFDRSGSSARYGMLYESLAHPGPAACANGAAVRP